MNDEHDEVLDDGEFEPVEHVLGHGDLRLCFPELSLVCIEELADAGGIRLRITEFGTCFDFEVDPAAKSIMTRHVSADYLHEHIRAACRLAMTIPV